MNDNILVPLDGSPFAERILPLAAAVAQRLEVPLELARVEPPAVLGYSQDMYHATLDVHAEERLLGASTYLETTARSFGGDDRRVRTTLLTSRSVADAICERARTTHARLVAMTTHGRTGISRAVLGSVADGVVRHSNVPVLLWRSTAVHATGVPGTPFRTVLVPLDGSPAAKAILPHASTLALIGQRHVLLVRVVPHVADSERSTLDPAEAAQAYLAETALHLRTEHPSLIVDTLVVRDDHAGTGITRIAMEAEADLLAMTSVGHGASRLLVGSTVDAVLRVRNGAMLLLRPTNG